MIPNNVLLWTLVAVNSLVAVSGFVKDLVTAAYFGTTAYADAFANSYFIVDTISANVVGFSLWIGASSVFGAALRHNTIDTRRATVRVAMLYTVAVSIVLNALLFVFRDKVIGVFGHSQTLLLTMGPVYSALLLMALVYPLYSVISGALQANGRFVATTVSPIVVNLSVILSVGLGMGFHWTEPVGVIRVAWGYSVGAVLALVVVLYLWILWERVQKLKLPWGRVVTVYSMERIVTGTKVATGYASYLLLQQILSFIERYLASRSGPGMVAGLSYANRISQLPNWVVISALMAIVIPNISYALEHKEQQVSTEMLGRAVKLGLSVCIPASVVIGLWATPLVRVLFERGNFGTDSVEITATFLVTYAASITSQSLAAVFFRTVAATGRMLWPIFAGTIATVCGGTFDICFWSYLGPGTVGIGSTIWGLIASIVLWAYLFRSGRIGSLLKRFDIVCLLVSNLLFAGVCMFFRDIWFDAYVNITWWGLVGKLALAGLIAVCIYSFVLLCTTRRTMPIWKRGALK